MWVYTYTYILYIYTQTTLGTWPSQQTFFSRCPQHWAAYVPRSSRQKPTRKPCRGKEGPTGGCFFVLTKEELGNNNKKWFGTLKETYTLKS